MFLICSAHIGYWKSINRDRSVLTLKVSTSSLLSITLAIPSIALMPMIPLRARLVCSCKGPAKSSVDTVVC